MTVVTGPLLERDAELAALTAYWAEARAGHGRLVFLGGEAGSGKTSVSLEFARRIAAGCRFLVGVCDAGSTPPPLGPLLDIADRLEVRRALEDREVSRSSLFARVRHALGRTPTLLLLEDLHWADEASLDLLRYLGRRLDGTPLLLLATFRDDEVTGRHPLAAAMGDLATTAQVRRLQLPLLTRRAVETLAQASGTDVDVAALHRSTDGNPFFVTEVLAVGAGRLPTTVRDAVIARARRVSPAARKVLETVAVVGPQSDVGLVLAVSGQPAPALDECVQGGMLVSAGPRLEFRHELARQAVLATIPPAERVDLHRRVLAQLCRAGDTDHRRLADHALAAGDSAAVLRHAPEAARRAARLGSHREATNHWQTVIRHGDSLPTADRADVLEALSYECVLVSRPVEALSARHEALTLREASGDTRSVGVDQRWMSRILWLLGRNAEAERYALAAVGTLESLDASADLAMAYSNVSHLRMLNGDADEALSWGEKARSAGQAAGDREVEAHALNNIGVALLRRGQDVEGRARLEESLALALADGLDEQAARAYTNIGAIQVIKRRLAGAEQSLRTGITYCDDRDLDQSAQYMRSWLAAVLIEQGRFDLGRSLAEQVLRRPQISVVNRITALLSVTLVALRRGEPQFRDQLTELHELARAAPEPLRMLPLALLEAEAAWTDGRPAEIGPRTDPIWAAFAGTSEPWILAELAWWRRLGGTRDHLAFAEPEPFVLMRDGRVRAASTAWTAAGRPFWSALALAAGSPPEAAESVATLFRLGAPATAAAVRRDLAAQGRPVPRGPRQAARNNAAGLTARELEVLGHLVQGRTDAEIARSLTLSERTVGHHVSAVLRKLGVPSRSRAAAAAAAILAPPT